MFQVLALSLALIAPQSDLEDFIHQPYVELIQSRAAEDLKSLRLRVEQERDEKIDTAKKAEDQWKKQLEAAREELKKLSTAAANRRTALHIEIAALERAIRDKTEEREQTIPAIYEAQLAKLWLLEHWPERQAEIRRRIDEGRARERRHGDVEDIGYRKLVKNPGKDIEVGQQAARQMMAGGWLPPELKDTEVQLYVRQLASKIAASSDLKVPLHVTVLESAQPRAVALPGGFLYITSGVLKTAHTESELVGVLAREIARIAAQHATRASKRSIVSKMFMPVAQVATGIFSGGINPGAYYGIGYGMQGLGGVVDHVFNGTNEAYQKEADQLGVQYAWKAGYDPRGFVNFLDAFGAAHGINVKSDLVSIEPPLPERLLNLFSEIEYLPTSERAVVNSQEFERVRERIHPGG